VLDLGEISPPLGEASYGHRSAMHIYDTILRGAQRMRDYGFEPLGWPQWSWRVFVKWEPDCDPYRDRDASLYSTDTLWIVGKKFAKLNALNPDEWDDAILLHEYGHHLAHLGIFAYHPPNDAGCGGHDWENPLECPPGTPAPGYGWEEGWADFVGAMLGPVGPDTAVSNFGYGALDSIHVERLNLETGWANFGIASASIPSEHANVGSRGPAYEAANAGALWDWVDAVDDDADPAGCSDHLSEGFERLLTTLHADYLLELDSLANVYMAYQHGQIGGDLSRARALFEVLCDHGWWRPDSVFAVGVPPGRERTPRFTLFPSPAKGPIVFTITAISSSAPPAIEVFDIAGRILWRAAATGVGEGSWRVLWDGRSLAGERVRPGLYFARCLAAGANLRRTLVVTR
jgi:hypothetical protein